jgi:hypothetical protein
MKTSEIAFGGQAIKLHIAFYAGLLSTAKALKVALLTVKPGVISMIELVESCTE